MPSINPALQYKIGKLRAYYTEPEDIADIDAIERRLRSGIRKQGISEMEPIKDIVEAGQKVIDDINMILLHDQKLTEFDRHVLFTKRDCYKFWIDRLKGNLEVTETSVNDFFDDRIKIIEDNSALKSLT